MMELLGNPDFLYYYFLFFLTFENESKASLLVITTKWQTLKFSLSSVLPFTVTIFWFQKFAEDGPSPDFSKPAKVYICIGPFTSKQQALFPLRYKVWAGHFGLRKSKLISNNNASLSLTICIGPLATVALYIYITEYKVQAMTSDQDDVDKH